MKTENLFFTAEAQRRGGVFDCRGNEAAKIQATLGVGK
jgi:hypothetical protein